MRYNLIMKSNKTISILLLSLFGLAALMLLVVMVLPIDTFVPDESIDETMIVDEPFSVEGFDSYYEALTTNMVRRAQEIYGAKKHEGPDIPDDINNVSFYHHYVSDEFQVILDSDKFQLGDEVFFDDAYLFFYHTRYSVENSLASRSDLYKIAVFHIIDEEIARDVLAEYSVYLEGLVGQNEDMFPSYSSNHTSQEDYELFIEHYSCSCGEYGNKEYLCMIEEDTMIIIYCHGGTVDSTRAFAESFEYYGFPCTGFRR